MRVCCANVRYGVGKIMDSKAGVKWATLSKWRDYHSIDCDLLSRTLALQDEYGLVWMVSLCPCDYAVRYLSRNDDGPCILSLILFQRILKLFGFGFYFNINRSSTSLVGNIS